MPTTTENLAGLGQAYVERVAPALAGAEYPLYAITDYAQGHESNDGRRLEGATELVLHTEPHPAGRYLDESLWT